MGASTPTPHAGAGPDGPLRSARAAYDSRAWEDAFDAYTAAAAGGTLPAEDLERLAVVARWARRFAEMLDAYERAQDAYARDGERRGAARMALFLAIEHYQRNEMTVAAAWSGRARRLLDGLEPGPEHGLLLWVRARGHLSRGDVARARELDEEAVAIGRRVGSRDVEALAQLDRGHALLVEGRVDAALEAIEEATAAALSGELDLWTTGTIFCASIFASRNRGDWEQASEWTDASLRWCRRASVSGFPGLCRFHRAEVLRLRGEYERAERDAVDAVEELLDAGPRYAAWALQELGEIRRRRGNREGAREAFRHAGELGFDPQPGQALLCLDEGRVAAAAQAIRGALDDPDAFVQEARPLLLPAAVTIGIAAGDHELATGALAELAERAQALGTPAVRAAAAVGRGELELARGDPHAAAAALRDGLRGWRGVDAPYESARARVLLGRALRACGSAEAGDAEITAARDALRRIGASGDAEQAGALLDASTGSERVIRTLMFTDIVDSTRLVEALGDEAWEHLLAWHDRALRSCFADHGGEEVKHGGDGFFAAFADAGRGVACAAAIQVTLRRHRGEAGFAPSVRIGVHTTETTMRGGDYHGRGVHAAARIAGAAAGGEVLVSRAALEAAGVTAHGELRALDLKGLAEPVEAAPLR